MNPPSYSQINTVLKIQKAFGVLMYGFTYFKFSGKALFCESNTVRQEENSPFHFAAFLNWVNFYRKELALLGTNASL